MLTMISTSFSMQKIIDKMLRTQLPVILILIVNLLTIKCDQLEDIFANCRISKPDFDECLKYALNQLNPLFKYGLPEYGGE